MSEFKDIRKHSAQHDLFNRIHSIAADQAFVREVQLSYNGRFEVIANQRCGTWYCDPSTSSKTYAYFKSTDGHTNNWNFNLRRANLSLASHAENQGGFILVDSTRKGKRMPDALSKTVPIWCAVINLAIKKTYGTQIDTELYLPPKIVSQSEKSQIQSKIPAWTDSLLASGIDILHLTKPIRPFFVHPSTSSLPDFDEKYDFTPIICLSASRWIEKGGDDIPTFTRLKKGGTVTFEYVPGAGDDDELWSRGLTPAIFHENRERLLAMEREELPELVDDLVLKPTHMGIENLNIEASSGPGSAIIGIPNAESRLAVNIGDASSSQAQWRDDGAATTVRALQVDKLPSDLPIVASLGKAAYLLCLPNPRSDGKGYVTALKTFREEIWDEEDVKVVLEAAATSDLEFARAVLSDKRQLRDDITKGLQPSVPSVEGRKVILPLALYLICADLDPRTLNKATIDKHLQHLVALWPDGNPPRVALKRVNDALMGNNNR